MSDLGGLRDQKNNIRPIGIINKIAAIKDAV
ncbi:MAG: isopropylmalate/isohomocitrate dehydrogenase, 3-isopropylmalate dehydrogenase [Thaumarchaeota archaeon CSP1-1]|nr:MAG: isopropylmalate/isohomocitrate dehydrogenase, 3-isopropylmalate dehydrogenase [Thaumarchaeota archaeon CSP1-1]